MMAVPCTHCGLRPRPHFRPFLAGELEFITLMKSAHLTFAANSRLLEAGEVGGSLFTLYEGWAIRYRHLADRSRQILDILLPGDLIGIESHVLGYTAHAVQAITPVSLCLLRDHSLGQLFQGFPEWGASLLRGLVEAQRRDDTWRTIIGRLDAPQRVAYLLLDIFDRLQRRDMVSDERCPFPLHRQHLGDLLGLSRVHVARVLSGFASQNLAHIDQDSLVLRDRAKLAALAGYGGIAAGPQVLL